MTYTALMIRLGCVKGNKMIKMQLSNNKLVDRGARFIAEELEISYTKALKLLKKHGSVAAAIQAKK